MKLFSPSPHVWIGVTTGLTLALVASPSWAQLDITGGGAVLENVTIFSPDDQSIGTENRAVLRSFDAPGDFLNPGTFAIQTNQGNIPANALFRVSTLPTIGITGNGLDPTTTNLPNNFVGSQGEILGTLSFLSVGPTGPLFFNIPTEIDFQVLTPATLPGMGAPATEFRAEGFILQETGFAADASAFGDDGQSQRVVRQTPVTVVQYQPMGQQADTVTILGTTVPSNSFSEQRDGADFTVNTVALSFEGGLVDTPPGFALEGSATNTDDPFFLDEPAEITSPGETLPILRPGPIIINLPDRPTVRRERPRNDVVARGRPLPIGGTQFRPVFPVFISVGVFVFSNVPTGLWCDPPAADGFEYEMTPRDIALGVPSRVFPGMTGVGQADDATFTAISGFPTNVDAGDTFMVAVDGIVLGEFRPGDELQFSDYADMLGDRLMDGGVRKFTVSGIDPAVDASDPVAFPLKLDFSTPTASFEMRALEVAANQDAETVADNSLTD